MTTALLDRNTQNTGFFHKSEYVMMAVVLFVVAAILYVDAQGPQQVGWASFAVGTFAAVALMLIGAYYRRTYKGAAWLGKSALVIALGSLLGMLMGIMFHQQMPRPEPVLTDAMLAIDAWFGFHWPDAVKWVASVPYLGTFLRYIYLSSLYQIILLVATLAWLKRDRDVDALILTNGFGLMLVYVVWQAFPNISQSTYFPIPSDIAKAADLMTNSPYGGLILEYATNGLAVVTMDSLLGAVAFPSYHMVMCALVVIFAWRTFLFWPYLIINIIMIPAILVHGAHHVADILGGIAVTGVAMIPAYLVSNYCHRLQ
jgi:hypothetical protein